MTYYNSITLIGAVFLLAITPGPGLFAVISRALKDGLTEASIMVMGLILGDIIYLLMAIYGLSAIAFLMGDFFIFIKYIGGLYLIYLGYKIYTSKIEELSDINSSNISLYANFFSGFFITLSNPKVIIFYLGFLPLFLNLNSLTSFDIMLVVLIVAITLSSVVLTYAYFASKSKQFFKNKTSMRRLNKISGGMMISAGSLLAIR